jgi:hypothetical protein
MQGTSRPAPGFFAALGGAFCGYIAGIFIAFLVLWPFAIASSTALAVGSADGYRGLGGLVPAALLIALAQIAITAWVTQEAASVLGDARVRFRRALAAVVLGYLANLFLGSAVVDVAALPVVGGAWVGPLVVALVVASGRTAPATSSYAT